MALTVVLSACGGGSSLGVIPAPVEQATFAVVQTQIFTPNCAIAGCHVASTAPFGLDLSAGASYANLVGVDSAEVPTFQLVRPGTSSDSYLYMKLTADPRILGDPMPLLRSPLSEADLLLLRLWIEQGAR